MRKTVNIKYYSVTILLESTYDSMIFGHCRVRVRFEVSKIEINFVTFGFCRLKSKVREHNIDRNERTFTKKNFFSSIKKYADYGYTVEKFKGF